MLTAVHPASVVETRVVVYFPVTGKSVDKVALAQALRDAVFKGDPNGTMCTVCKDFFNALVTVLTNPQDQAEILQLIETPVCDAVGPLKGVCDDLIK